MIFQDGPPVAADAPPNGSHQEEQCQEYQELNNHEQDYLERKDSEVDHEEEEKFLIRNTVVTFETDITINSIDRIKTDNFQHWYLKFLISKMTDTCRY